MLELACKKGNGWNLLVSNWLFPFTGYGFMKYNLIPITCNFGRLLIKWALIYVLGMLTRLIGQFLPGLFSKNLV